MRNCGCIILLWGFVCALCGESKTPLTNEDVFKLVRAGLGEAVVVRAIEANEAHLDVSPQALLVLKEAGLSEKVLAAMLSKAQAQATARKLEASRLDPGVYVKRSGGYVEVEPEVLSWEAPVNTFGRERPIRVTLVAGVMRPGSRLTLSAGTEFLIVCPAAVPECEYQLLRAESKTDRRYFRMEALVNRSVLGLGSRVENRIAFDREKVFDRGTSIRPATLAKGEYGFLPLGAVKGAPIADKIHTFTIQ